MQLGSLWPPPFCRHFMLASCLSITVVLLLIQSRCCLQTQAFDNDERMRERAHALLDSAGVALNVARTKLASLQVWFGLFSLGLGSSLEFWFFFLGSESSSLYG